MNDILLVCEQAIFTSIRSRMGEGYRIIAASRGLSAPDKQCITRNSPSHESLCPPSTGAHERHPAVAFYSLPSGRLCVSISFPAGAEHTGRGGDRVYTHCVAFPADQFAHTGYNPFSVVRAMSAAGLMNPQLKSEVVLPTIELQLAPGALTAASTWKQMPPQHRSAVLSCMLDGRPAVVDLPDEWPACAEAAILGLPGPARTELSFSAGMKFSSTRRHQLQMLRDEKSQLQHRLSGQSLTFIDCDSSDVVAEHGSAWSQFVERLWSRGDLRELARRTSRQFADCQAQGLERVGTLYNMVDTLSHQQPPQILALAAGLLDSDLCRCEATLCVEFLERAASCFVDKIAVLTWSQAAECWRPLVTLWRRSPAAAEFAAPLLERMLRLASAESPVASAEAALLLENGAAPSNYAARLHGVVDEILRRLGQAITRDAAWQASDSRIDELAARWRSLRPRCPIIAEWNAQSVGAR